MQLRLPFFLSAPRLTVVLRSFRKRGTVVNNPLSFQIKRYLAFAISFFIVSLLSLAAFAQTTISTGSIQGTITDPSGAVVSGARITITNKGTSQSVTVTSTSAGSYASGALLPGAYTMRVEAKGFKTV